MDFQKILDLIKAHVDIVALEKDLIGQFLVPLVDAFEAKVKSKQIDIIPGTDIDATIIEGFCEQLKAFAAKA